MHTAIARLSGNPAFGRLAVSDVAVIGIPDEEFGEQVKAIVERRAWW